MLTIHNEGLETQPAVHAFIVGISDYTHLPEIGEPTTPDQMDLRKLSSPAASAFAFYQWLTAGATRLARPLATTHLLLAPSPVELARQPEMQPFASVATFDAVQEAADQWRRFCAGHRGKQAIFFFCGHGVQPQPNESFILMQDWGKFGRPLSRAMISTKTLVEAMAPQKAHARPDFDFLNIARDQIYFIDACRDNPEQLHELRSFTGETVLEAILPGPDDRSTPTFFSTLPGSQALGVAGGKSLFTTALLEALALACEGEDSDDSGNAIWPVKARFFCEVLKYRIGQQALQHGLSLDLAGNVQGPIGDTILHLLPERPDLDVLIFVKPQGAVGHANVVISRIDSMTGDRVMSWMMPEDGKPRPPHPFAMRLKLDVYHIGAKHDDGSKFGRLWTPKASATGSQFTIAFQPSAPPPPAADV